MLLDLASFACSIYMRGIKNVIFIPTTLLAVVDATVGGKNGVNWEGTKNMLGTIRQPN
jgi:3-dehydroquinate synthase